MKEHNTVPNEIKKEIYEDGFKDTLIESGKALSLIPRTIKNVFSNLERWNLNQEFRTEKLKIELAKEINKINEDDIVEANPNIFIPSIQALSYSWDEEEIRTLYIKLMVSDMNANKKKFVHPGYSEVIKQLSSLDAKIFTKIYTCEVMPFCILQEKVGNGERMILEYLFTDEFYVDATENELVRSINNLDRLKLINIPQGYYYTDNNHYSMIENGMMIQKYKNNYNQRLNVTRGMINKTEFGKSFFEVCCK